VYGTAALGIHVARRGGVLLERACADLSSYFCVCAVFLSCLEKKSWEGGVEILVLNDDPLFFLIIGRGCFVKVTRVHALNFFFRDTRSWGSLGDELRNANEKQ
jgi:hypothetical protein